MTTDINKMRQMIEDAVEELICIFLHKAQEQLALESGQCTDRTLKGTLTEFLKFIGPRGQNIMRSANNVGNAGPHVRQTFLNDVFTFLTEVGNAGRIVNTGTNSVNSEFVTALNM
jgi:ABC-type enterochelin transport system substrate-binding protein